MGVQDELNIWTHILSCALAEGLYVVFFCLPIHPPSVSPQWYVCPQIDYNDVWSIMYVLYLTSAIPSTSVNNEGYAIQNGPVILYHCHKGIKIFNFLVWKKQIDRDMDE